MSDRPANHPAAPASEKVALPPRRILYVDHTAKLGGGEIALLHLVQHLDRTRYEPVVVLSTEGPLRDRLLAAGIETHLLSLASSVLEVRKDSLGLGTLLRIRDIGRTLHLVGLLARFIRVQNIALVHTNSLKSDLFGGLAARLARVPLIWHIRDRIDADYLPGPVVHVFRWLCRWLPQYVIANSQATLDTLAISDANTQTGSGVGTQTVSGAERFGAIYSGIDLPDGDDAAARTSVVHDGVRPAPFAFPSTTSVRRIGLSVRRIGLIGRISPWKGQHIFLRAAAKVRQNHPDTSFLIIGAALFNEQVYEQEIQALTTELGLEDSVEFLGFREDVPSLIAGLDILVHASTTAEPFGQVIVEGMAAGKPVVATDGGGPREIVLPGKTGLLVPMGDEKAMADAVNYLLDHPEIAQEMGRCGRERAQEHFSIQRTARLVEAVYQKLLAQRD